MFVSSVVGTSNGYRATWFSYQRKTFYANGRFWVFYSDGTNMVFRTSTDGLAWSGATVIRASSESWMFSIWFDGTYVHYVFSSGIAPIIYRRGTPGAGVITWTDEQTALEEEAGKEYNYPFVSVDTDGYVWISYKRFDGANGYPWVTTSGNNDGTWGATPGGFPYQLSASWSLDWRTSVIPLTAGKMFVIYAKDNDPIYAKRWEGAAWGANVTTTSDIKNGEYHSAVAEGDDVHLTFLENVSYDILYVKYAYSTNSFGAETTLQARTTWISPPVISRNTDTNDLYVFYATKTTNSPAGHIANHIYYIKYTALTSTWENTVDWIDESTDTLTSSDRLTGFYNAYGGYVGLVYMTKTVRPFNVCFDYISTAVTYVLTLASDKTDYWTDEPILLSGLLTVNGSPIEGAPVTLYKNGVPHLDTVTLADGIYGFADPPTAVGPLEYYAEYVIGEFIFRSTPLTIRRN